MITELTMIHRFGLRDAMDLAYLTGQRPSDVVKLDETKIRDGTLELRQGKTGMPLRIEVQGELAAVIERIKARKRAAAVYTTRLVVDEDCRPLTLGRISDHFVRARAPRRGSTRHRSSSATCARKPAPIRPIQAATFAPHKPSSGMPM